MRDSKGRFTGNKYQKINGIWFKGSCNKCSKLIRSHKAKYCRECITIIKPPNLIHNQPHTVKTRQLLRKINSKTKLTYSGIHSWLHREYGSANRCENLDCQNKSTYFDWANISGQYKKDITHYRMLCRSCHHLFDKSNHEPRFI